jgi:hypothetical protein
MQNIASSFPLTATRMNRQQLFHAPLFSPLPSVGDWAVFHRVAGESASKLLPVEGYW